jgi:hypothetical protein
MQVDRNQQVRVSLCTSPFIIRLEAGTERKKLAFQSIRGPDATLSPNDATSHCESTASVR